MQTPSMIALAAMGLGVASAGALVALRLEDAPSTRRSLLVVLALLSGLIALPLVVAFARPLYLFYLPAVLPMLLALPIAVHRYAATQAARGESRPLRRRDALLPIAGLILMVGYWSLPHPSKEAMFVDGVLPPGPLPAALALATVGLLLIWSVVSLFYLLTTASELRVYRQQLKAIYSNTERYELRWIDALLGLLVALWAAAALSLVLDNMGFGLPFPGEVVFGLAIAVLLVLSGSTTPAPASPDTELDQEQPTEKYSRSALEQDRAAQIAKRIETAMRQDKLYLDPTLSLQKLSWHVRTPPNLVSQTLNEQLETTFFDYIAHWRIESAKPLIKAGNDPVLTIALDVGFNSRSTFYKAFKRETGMTPKAFREAKQ